MPKELRPKELRPKELRIEKLSYEAGGHEILRRLSLTVSPAEVHALIGTNGTGKSTLANIIMGLGGYRPMGGKVYLGDKDLNGLAIHERAALGITLAWQEPVRFEGITVADYLSINRPNGDDNGMSISGCLDLVGLQPSSYLERFVDRTLSGGERKRIELASVLAMRPGIVILDEPDSGIDILSIDALIKVIRAFSDYGAGVLVITHREEIAGAADVASHLCAGRIVYTGDPAEVTRRFRDMACLRCVGTECEDATA